MRSLRPHARERSFGLSVGAVLIFIAGVTWWRGRVVPAEALAGLGSLLVVFGALGPRWLKGPSDWWWTLAGALGYINARIILTLIFVIVLTPLGVIWRVVGRDPLHRRRRSWPGWSPYPVRFRDRAHYQRMY